MRSRAALSVPRRRLVGAVAGLWLTPWPVGGQNTSSVRTRPTSTPLFRIDVPERDWRLVPGGVNTLGSVVHDDAPVAIVIEHELLSIALTADEIDATFTELELGAIRERESGGTDFAAAVAQLGQRRTVVVNYQRRGAGGLERVRVFVLVHGRHLYRLVCTAPSSQFERYAPLFLAVCGSFTPLGSTA